MNHKKKVEISSSDKVAVLLETTTLTQTEIADKVGCSSHLVGKIQNRDKIRKEDFKLKKLEEQKTLPTPLEEIEKRRLQARVRDLESRLKNTTHELEYTLEKYDEALLLKSKKYNDIPIIEINNHIKDEAVPIIQLSDWHVEERIERSTTHGLNEFNPDIAEMRVKKLTENILKLVKKERQDVTINNIVLCLGGDFINGYLHDHDVQMNFKTPIEAVIFAKELISGLLKSLIEYGKFKKITCVCIRGNHGRLTKRMQSSNDYKMNLEAIIYQLLKQEFKQIEWYIPDSELGYFKVFDKTIRAFHGHQIKFQGGVGDLTIPMNKAIMKWDKTTKADWNLSHHYHSFWTPTRNCSLNGSLCGYNSYAVSLGFQYEPPLQSFHLLDKKKGFTVRVPLFCE